MSNLKPLRAAAGLSQTQLAAAIGKPQQYIAKLETGVIDIRNITLINAIALADALGVDPRDLIQT